MEESVVARVLAALTSLCELGLFQKMRIWELMSATLGFLYHPNIWIRQGTVAFISAAVAHLPSSDVWCILYPSLRHFLRSDVATITEQSLLSTMKPQVWYLSVYNNRRRVEISLQLPRHILDSAIQWAMKADKTSFWNSFKKAASKVESPRESMVSVRKHSTSVTKKSDECVPSSF